jgi:hypothetical protein
MGNTIMEKKKEKKRKKKDRNRSKKNGNWGNTPCQQREKY